MLCYTHIHTHTHTRQAALVLPTLGGHPHQRNGLIRLEKEASIPYACNWTIGRWWDTNGRICLYIKNHPWRKTTSSASVPLEMVTTNQWCKTLHRMTKRYGSYKQWVHHMYWGDQTLQLLYLIYEMYSLPLSLPPPSRLHAHTHQVPQLITDLCTYTSPYIPLPPCIFTHTLHRVKKEKYIYPSLSDMPNNHFFLYYLS